jgi:HAD superfamily hydrolase (TIGR01549 family)
MASHGDQADFLDGVRLVLFDLDGTLCHQQPNAHDILLACAAELGYTFAPIEERAGMRWSHTYWSDARQVHADKSSYDEFGFWANYARGYLEAMGVPSENCARAAETFAIRLTRGSPSQERLAPGALDLLQHLHTRRLAIGLVSNRREPVTRTVFNLGILEYVDFTLAAGQIGRWKPDPGIYLQALALAGGVSPQEAVYVGDNYYTDIVGANGIGMRAILVDEHELFSDIAADCLVLRQLAELRNLVA